MLNKLLLNIAFVIMRRFFGVVAIHSKNDEVKCIHFARTGEDFKQSIIEKYFDILKTPEESTSND